MAELCSILFPYPNDMEDTTGCLHGFHNDGVHIFRNSKGKLIAWHDDMECDCGCWDEYEQGDELVCGVYWEVDKIETPKY